MKLAVLMILYIISSSPSEGSENCEEINAKFYWFNSLVNETTILNDNEEKRIWYVNKDRSKCYISNQREINSPGTIYTGYVMALEELGSDFNPDNIAKIEKITGIAFEDSDQFDNWFNKNRNNFFWSFEKNRLTVLPNGFRCQKITAAGGKLYWFNYSLGTVVNMDTSSDKRLWSDATDGTKCFISPLSEINDQKNQILGFKLALNHVGSKSDEFRRQIIERFKLLTNNNTALLGELNEYN